MQLMSTPEKCTALKYFLFDFCFFFKSLILMLHLLTKADIMSWKREKEE